MMILPLLLLHLLCRTSWTRSLGMNDILGPEELGAVLDLDTFLLDRTTGIMYIGGRDTILALDTRNFNSKPQTIVWETPETKRLSCMGKGKTKAECHNFVLLMEFLGDGRIFVCGTYAFDPQCAYLDISTFTLEKMESGAVKMESGKTRCPYNPKHTRTSLMADGQLYTAVTTNFLGTQFDISRVTGLRSQRTQTIQTDIFLLDPDFVGSAYVEQQPHDPTGEDGKLYFFFTEQSTEYEFYTRVRVPRVARVCKSDVGGLKTLQRIWTTYLKFELVCEDKVSHQRYNILKDVFTIEHTAGVIESTHFYGLFTSQWDSDGVSAVCVYSLSDIDTVFGGPFKSVSATTVPTPRPGKCLNNNLRAQGFNSSLTLPDMVLQFVRKHPLMESLPAAPLLVRKGVTYTKLAVSRPEDHHQGILLLLGTDRGELHQVAVVGYNASLLQEVPMFPSPEPVNNIFVYQGWAVVSSPASVSRVQAEGCDPFPTCEVCARARGLGCLWSSSDNACKEVPAAPGPGDAVDEALKMCNRGEGRCNPVTKEMRVDKGLRVVLPCVQLSPRPCSWKYPPHRWTRQRQSDLELTASEETVGQYICTCQESDPGSHSVASCRRAAYHLTLESHSYEGTVETEGRQVVAVYMLLFFAGFAFGGIVLYFTARRGSIGRQCRHLQDGPNGRDLLGSAATPQSPTSASLLSEGFHLTEKRNGTATTSKPAPHQVKQGTAGHHGNSFSGSLVRRIPITDDGKSRFTNCKPRNCGTVDSEMLDADMREGRTGTGLIVPEELDEVDEGLGDALGDGLKGLEEELGSFPMFKTSAPLAPCEESSI